MGGMGDCDCGWEVVVGGTSVDLGFSEWKALVGVVVVCGWKVVAIGGMARSPLL